MKLIQIIFSGVLLALSITSSQIPGDDMEFVPAFDSENNPFDEPIWIAENPAIPGMFMILEQHTGNIFTVEEVNGDWERTLFLANPGMNENNESGLLSLVFHPDFIENGKYYYYKIPSGNRAQVFEGVMEENRREDSGESRLVFEVIQPEGNHQGGLLRFSPDPLDPYLYIALGDGGGGGDQHGAEGNGQNTDNVLGAILRIDVDNPADDQEYGIPLDNPFAQGGGAPEIWAWGFRNPWGFSFDRQEPYTMWVGDVGQNLREEVALVEMGDNHGWRIREGATCFNVDDFTNPFGSCNMDGLKEPLVDFERSEANCITGGMVYRGNPESKYYGIYLVADYGQRKMWGITEANGELDEMARIEGDIGKITSFNEDLAGNIYVTKRNEGTIERLNLGEIAELPVKTREKSITEMNVFSQLILKQVYLNRLEFEILTGAEHIVKLLDLQGRIAGETRFSGIGTFYLKTNNNLRGIYIVHWQRDGVLVTRRIHLP